MHVIILDNDINSRINGIGTYLKTLISILKHMGISVTRVGYNSSCKAFTKKEEDGVHTLLLPQIPTFYYFKVLDKFLGLYIEDSTENLFMFHYSPCDDLIRILKQRFPLSKFSFTIHDMIWTALLWGDAKKLKEIITSEPQKEEKEEHVKVRKSFEKERTMYALVDAVIVLSEGTYHVLKDIYKIDSKKIYLIPNGLKDTYSPVSNEIKREIRSNKFLSEHEKILLFAGRVHYMKGVYSLIRCFEEVLLAFPNCRLVIAGSLLDTPKTLSLAGNAASKIIFTGQLSKEELNEWIKLTDIGVLPSYTEQCCYWGIELMMNRLPVIATDGFNMSEMFVKDFNAKIVPIGNWEEMKTFEHNLACEIVRLLQSDVEREELGEQGRLVYQSRYTDKIMNKGYQTFINRLLKKT